MPTTVESNLTMIVIYQKLGLVVYYTGKLNRNMMKKERLGIKNRDYQKENN